MEVLQPLPPAGSQMHAWQIHAEGYFAICVCAQNLGLRGLGRSVSGQRTVSTGRPSCRVGRGWAEPSWVLQIHQPSSEHLGGNAHLDLEKSLSNLLEMGKETLGTGPWRWSLQRSQTL